MQMSAIWSERKGWKCSGQCTSLCPSFSLVLVDKKKVTSWRTWRSALSAKSRHRSVVARKPEMKNSNPAIEQSPGQTMACVKQMLFRGEQQSKSPNMASLFFRFILSNNRRPESFPLMDRRKPCRAGDLSRRCLHLITAKMAQQAARNRS